MNAVRILPKSLYMTGCEILFQGLFYIKIFDISYVQEDHHHNRKLKVRAVDFHREIWVENVLDSVLAAVKNKENKAFAIRSKNIPHSLQNLEMIFHA